MLQSLFDSAFHLQLFHFSVDEFFSQGYGL
jgi:hypothetical protein